MKLGLLTAVYQHLPLEQVLDRARALSLDAVEVGTGNYPGAHHCDTEALLGSRERVAAFRTLFEERGLAISALACHGNPLHPDPAVAGQHHETFLRTIALAERLEVDRVTLFSGCPGDEGTSRRPNWVTCAWPEDYRQTLEWQWEERVLPYWRAQAARARDHGVRLCFEMHPGFVVYNPPTLIRLRREVGPEVGANLDPSHLFWQGIDVVEAVRRLGDAIYHVHAKDTALNPSVARTAGVLDTTPMSRVGERAWIFRTVGYGNDVGLWKHLVSALREVGYDGVVSIEHEDALASIDEGVEKAVSLLRDCLLREPPARPWWTA